MTQFSEITKAYYIDGVGTETEIDALNLWRYNLYTKGAVDPVFYTNFVQETNRMQAYEPGRALLNGAYVSATITSPTVISGCRAVTWGAGGNVAWPSALLEDLKDKGNIFFNWTPNYTGTPQSDVVLFEIETPKLKVTHTSAGDIVVLWEDHLGATLKTLTDTQIVTEGEERRFHISWTMDDSPNNVVDLFTNDILSAQDVGFGNITRGTTSSSYITNFAKSNVEGECGKVGPLYIYNTGADIPTPIMTLEGISMTLEGDDMILP